MIQKQQAIRGPSKEARDKKLREKIDLSNMQKVNRVRQVDSSKNVNSSSSSRSSSNSTKLRLLSQNSVSGRRRGLWGVNSRSFERMNYLRNSSIDEDLAGEDQSDLTKPRNFSQPFFI